MRFATSSNVVAPMLVGSTAPNVSGPNRTVFRAGFRAGFFVAVFVAFLMPYASQNNQVAEN